MSKLIGRLLYKWQMIKKVFISRYLTSIVNSTGGRIAGDVEIEHPENIYIGENSFVNGGQLFAGKSSRIVIGDNCMISYDIHIRTTYHNYKDRKKLMREQGMEEKDIVIEDNCWIGHSVHIMSGVTVHTGSVVAAGAVVTKDVPSNCVVGGIPAKIISML